MIPFLILVGIFLIFGATEKTWTDVHLVDFKLGMQLTKLGLVHTLCHSSRISLGACKNYGMSVHNFICVHAQN
jgi:hypothetical protein